MDDAKLERLREEIRQTRMETRHLAARTILDAADQLIERIQAGETEFSVRMNVGGYFTVANGLAIKATSRLAQDLDACDEMSFSIFNLEGEGAFNFKRKIQAAA